MTSSERSEPPAISEEEMVREHTAIISNNSLQPSEGVDFSWENLSYRVRLPKNASSQSPQSPRFGGSTPQSGEVAMSPASTAVASAGPTVDNWKFLVRDFSGTACKGRTLAIMGPSGAGKTTFLNTLAGRIRSDADHVVDGLAFLNRTLLTNEYKKVISFVAQDDIVMGKETPREALYFNYRIKLNATAEEATRATDEMLRRLHLVGCADTLLGIPGLLKGVSGGEKKRTNIGSELITNPRILILDEPTTGLDSVNAYRVGVLLRELAHTEGRTVLCTIHTPSSELFAEFDDVLLLAKGRVAYHGPREEAPAYFASLGHPLPPLYNPSEYYMNLMQSEDAVITKILDAWEEHRKGPAAVENASLARCPQGDAIVLSDPMLLKHCASIGSGYGLQLGLLSARSWRLVRRDPLATFGRLVQTLFFAILMGLFYYKLKDDSAGVQDREGALFMIALNSVFLSLMNGIGTFPPERAVFLMEQGNDTYNAFIYFLAKTVAELPFQIIFPLVYICITYWMIGLAKDAGVFFATAFIVIMASNTSYSFGLLATAFFPSVETAMAFIPMILLPMMIAGGLFANTNRLDPYWIWLDYISIPRFTFMGMVVNEFHHIGSLCPNNATNCQYHTGEEVINFLGFQKWHWWLSVISLGIIMIVCRFLAALCLYVQGRMRRSNLNFKHALAHRAPSPVNHTAKSPIDNVA